MSESSLPKKGKGGRVLKCVFSPSPYNLTKDKTTYHFPEVVLRLGFILVRVRRKDTF
jgi:hypothetical protein